MPFKSKAQRRKFYAMAESGEISPKVVKEWEHATPKNKKLPEKVSSMNKTAFELGFEKKAGIVAEGLNKALNFAEGSHFGHAAELAGLGILTAPSISNMVSGKGTWKDKAEVGGLGVLALPSIAHFASHLRK